jgi:hypothetical protein
MNIAGRTGLGTHNVSSVIDGTGIAAVAVVETQD